jgi:hypothetical protein
MTVGTCLTGERRCSGRRSRASCGGHVFGVEGDQTCPKIRIISCWTCGEGHRKSIPDKHIGHRHIGHLLNDSAACPAHCYRNTHLEVGCAPRCVGASSTSTGPKDDRHQRLQNNRDTRLTSRCDVGSVPYKLWLSTVDQSIAFGAGSAALIESACRKS